MNWTAAIERNHTSLKRVLAAMIAMAGFAPEAAREPQNTLPRRLHRAILRLLRPAEAAVRRLVIIVARDIVLPPPALRASFAPP